MGVFRKKIVVLDPLLIRSDIAICIILIDHCSSKFCLILRNMNFGPN